MPFDFRHDVQTPAQQQRAERGLVNHLKGMAAEESVVATYLERGFSLLARRWRGCSGEIDLIFAFGPTIFFVEVKASRDFSMAATHLSTRQISVISSAIDEYLGDMPMGTLTEIQFDLALVDQRGSVHILENVLAG